MAALTIVAGSVVKGSGASTEAGIAGASITAGQCVYKDSSNLFQLSDANGAAALRTVYGIALNTASANQPLTVLTAGPITIGATVVLATIYVGGATAAGDINPAADLTTGWYVSILGVAISTTVLQVQIMNAGVAA